MRIAPTRNFFNRHSYARLSTFCTPKPLLICASHFEIPGKKNEVPTPPSPRFWEDFERGRVNYFFLNYPSQGFPYTPYMNPYIDLHKLCTPPVSSQHPNSKFANGGRYVGLFDKHLHIRHTSIAKNRLMSQKKVINLFWEYFGIFVRRILFSTFKEDQNIFLFSTPPVSPNTPYFKNSRKMLDSSQGSRSGVTGVVTTTPVLKVVWQLRYGFDTSVFQGDQKPH